MISDILRYTHPKAGNLQASDLAEFWAVTVPALSAYAYQEALPLVPAVQTIAGWQPPPAAPRSVVPLHPGKGRKRSSPGF